MIEVVRDGPVWTLRLNRPAKANSLSRDMLRDLTAHASAAADEARVLVLTGTGTVFSAGADLEEARAGLATDPVWENLSGTIAGLRCLTIAALNGTVAGGAFGMVLACDLRLAVPDAKFFYPVMKLGFLPQPSDPRRLSDLVGPARAKLILMAGQKIGADDARDFGLVDEVVAPDDMDRRIGELAEAAVAADATHVAQIKAMF